MTSLPDMNVDSTGPGSCARDIFATTHWTLVVSAGTAPTAQSERALERLCQTYWYPLYAYVRRRGHSKEDAEDLTQAFFARFLARNYLSGLTAGRGRFRAFLLASLKHFLSNEWDKTQRQKRGAGAHHLSLDWQTADTQFQIAGEAGPGPEQAYDREWAMALLGKVVAELQREYEESGKGALFAQLRGFLSPEQQGGSYSRACETLKMEEGAVRVAAHRMRKRYRQLLREEIGHTLSDPSMVEEEIRSLFSAFR